jgi:cell shape-determining protein MreC
VEISTEQIEQWVDQYLKEISLKDKEIIKNNILKQITPINVLKYILIELEKLKKENKELKQQLQIKEKK